MNSKLSSVFFFIFISMSRKIRCIMGFFLAAAVNAVFAADVIPPAGAARTPSVSDFMPHTSDKKEFNETWAYQFVFDNGTRAFVNYTSMYVPGTGKKFGCDLTFWNFKGKAYTIGRQYPPERLKSDKVKASLDVKGQYAMENMPGKGHHVLFSADKNGKYLLDVTVETATPGKVIGNGIWKIGSEQFAQYIHIPYGRVSGKIAVNEDTLQVKGYIYMDQTWQTTQATNIVKRTINFSTPSNTSMYSGRISIDTDGKPFGYVLYANNGEVKTLTPKSITDNESAYNGSIFPKGNLKFDWNEGEESLSFSTKQVYQKASILDKIEGWLAKKAFKVAAGEILFYRGKSEGNNGKRIDWNITGVKD